jgi:DNA polymerase theta
MIYGMGAKALGEQLEVEEKEAAVFMDSFKNAYPGMNSQWHDVIKCVQFLP